MQFVEIVACGYLFAPEQRRNGFWGYLYDGNFEIPFILSLSLSLLIYREEISNISHLLLAVKRDSQYGYLLGGI